MAYTKAEMLNRIAREGLLSAKQIKAIVNILKQKYPLKTILSAYSDSGLYGLHCLYVLRNIRSV
jgi:hypothetical protein